MAKTISAVVNTLNEELNIEKCLRSLEFCDEIVVVDMMSEDDTKMIAKKFTQKVYDHRRTGYVEPARNFAIGKASGDYILIVDADETIPGALARRLRALADGEFDGYALIPRDNIIFGASIKHSGWWPDYNVRFFRAGRVSWDDRIHSVPVTSGEKVVVEAERGLAIRHQNYPSISSYVLRLDRYTTVQAKELRDTKINISSFLTRPWSEFVRRYFAMAGYKDGIRGLVLCILQAISEFVVVAKVWEAKDYPEIEIDENMLIRWAKDAAREWKWWDTERKLAKASLLEKVVLKIKRRV